MKDDDKGYKKPMEESKEEEDKEKKREYKLLMKCIQEAEFDRDDVAKAWQKKKRTMKETERR